MNTIRIGALGEKAAARFLKRNHYKILKRNLHVSHNEIDIIAQNKSFIVFAEVKTRSVANESTECFLSPSSAVTKEKQRHLVAAARRFLLGYKKHRQPRFDVIEVFLDKETMKIIKINHITNAFGI